MFRGTLSPVDAVKAASPQRTWDEACCQQGVVSTYRDSEACMLCYASCTLFVAVFSREAFSMCVGIGTN